MIHSEEMKVQLESSDSHAPPDAEDTKPPASLQAVLAPPGPDLQLHSEPQNEGCLQGQSSDKCQTKWSDKRVNDTVVQSPQTRASCPEAATCNIYKPLTGINQEAERGPSGAERGRLQSAAACLQAL